MELMRRWGGGLLTITRAMFLSSNCSSMFYAFCAFYMREILQMLTEFFREEAAGCM
jgi:hypothetical protein